MTRSNQPIIVGGCHRSGTSLIRRLLNAHSRIYVGPEVKFFRDFYADYVDDPVRHARFILSARAMLAEADLLDVLGNAFVRMHELGAARAGKSRWGDKAPENMRYLREWERILGDAFLLVHVARNPLDTIASIKEAIFPFAIPQSLDMRIALYREFSQSGLDFCSKYPERYYRVLYEELVASPEATLKSLMEWLGEKFERTQLDFNRFPQQEGLEDPKVATTQRVHSDSVGRWRAVLSEEEVRAIWEGTAPLWRSLDPERRFERLVAMGTMRPEMERESGGRESE